MNKTPELNYSDSALLNHTSADGRNALQKRFIQRHNVEKKPQRIGRLSTNLKLYALFSQKNQTNTTDWHKLDSQIQIQD